MQAAVGWNLHLELFCVYMCMFIFVLIALRFVWLSTCVCFIFSGAYIYRNIKLCVSVYVQCGTPPSCLPDSTYSPFTLLCSISPPPLPLFPRFPTPPLPLLSHSAWLARTCMSVDSVLCLLPWHAPTSLQCSPVCINWQRDSGYVVCRVGRIEKEKGGGVGKRQCNDTIVTITDGRTDGKAVWQVPRGTDRQIECVLLSVHREIT